MSARPDARRQSARDRLTRMKDGLERAGAYVRSGGDFDPWDLEVRGGMLGAVRVVTAVEEHGAGHQLVRVRTSPSPSIPGAMGSLVLVTLSALALADGALVAGLVLWGAAALVALRALRDMAVAAAAVRELLDEGSSEPG